ncbi:MAG: CRISPR system precrRNA processing endoribonuclease RAMP protein Cas6 [Bryobacterales bacterium]|nr:CRISPR system precrRNA processing endoribonuclease RAMP protein Cas6 [Bryobacterales bacterium]
MFRQSEFPDALVLSLGEGSEASSINGKAPSDVNETGRLRVQFLTPTELKHEGRIVETPDAPVLIARIFDRISALVMIYGDEHAEPDAAQRTRRELLEAASRLRLARTALSMVEAERVSSRTGQKHGLEGFVGEAEYEGPCDALRHVTPWLRAAAFTGVGRQTVWGKGEIGTQQPHH